MLLSCRRSDLWLLRHRVETNRMWKEIESMKRSHGIGEFDIGWDLNSWRPHPTKLEKER